MSSSQEQKLKLKVTGFLELFTLRKIQMKALSTQDLINHFLKILEDMSKFKKTTEDLTIGDKCFLVRKEYIGLNANGARIIVAKVKTFENKKGIAIPIFTEVGNSKRELTMENYLPFVEVSKAIEAII
jgi:hypothetical protein